MVTSGLPNVCRECAVSIDEKGVYHAPAFGMYFRRQEVDLDTLSLPLQSLIVYCQQCMFDQLYQNLIQVRCTVCRVGSSTYCYHPDAMSGLLVPADPSELIGPEGSRGDGYVCRFCTDVLIQKGVIKRVEKSDLKSSDFGSSDPVKIRTCVKCQTTRTNSDGKTTTDVETDEHGTVSFSVTQLEDEDGFRVDGYWIDCKDHIGSRRVGFTEQSYRLQEDIQGWLCSPCFEEQKGELLPEEILRVKCDHCHQKFPSAMGCDCENGIGCCSSVTDGWIRFGYGSCFDDDVLLWKALVRPEEYRGVNQICDECTKKFLAEDLVVWKDY